MKRKTKFTNIPTTLGHLRLASRDIPYYLPPPHPTPALPSTHTHNTQGYVLTGGFCIFEFTYSFMLACIYVTGAFPTSLKIP